jgi:hypothetical protein
MPPAAARRPSDTAVRAALVGTAAATTDLVVRPPQLVAPASDHQRRALDALLGLLAAALGRNDAGGTGFVAPWLMVHWAGRPRLAIGRVGAGG